MKSKIHCHSQKELAKYLAELTAYFNRYGTIPDEKRSIALPDDGVLRIRFDKNRLGGAISITLSWNALGGGKGCWN